MADVLARHRAALKPAIIAGTFITVLPMLGDYYTNQLLSGAPGTTMIGNAIEGQLDAPGETGQGAVLSLMVLVVLLIPMIYYVVSTPGLEGDMRPSLRLMRNLPWRRPWAMEGFTWLYIIWSIVPIGIAVLFSFNKGASQSTWQGFSTKWYVGSSVNSVLAQPRAAPGSRPDARARDR